MGLPATSPSVLRRVAPRILWQRHPAVRAAEQLTAGERAADVLRNGMGSWAFVVGALMFLTGWMLANGDHGFDPYPFILLNLVLSCLAALQGAVLIAAKRADQITAELATHDYETNFENDDFIKEVRALVRSIQHHVGAPDPGDVDGPITTRESRCVAHSAGTR